MDGECLEGVVLPSQLYWHRYFREEQKETKSSEVDVK